MRQMYVFKVLSRSRSADLQKLFQEGFPLQRICFTLITYIHTFNHVHTFNLVHILFNFHYEISFCQKTNFSEPTAESRKSDHRTARPYTRLR